MKNKILVFIALFVLWLVLSASFGAAEILFGLIFSFVTVYVSDRLFGARGNNVNPLNYSWLSLYAIMLFWDITKASFDSLRGLLRLSQAEKPGLIELRTKLTDDTALGVLAGTVTLLAGAMTVTIDKPNSVFQVCRVPGITGPSAAAMERALAKYEKILKKVYG